MVTCKILRYGYVPKFQGMVTCLKVKIRLNVEIWLHVQILRYGYVSKCQDLAMCLTIYYLVIFKDLGKVKEK